MEFINIKSTKHEEIIDITNILINHVKNNKIENGFIYIYCPHTTAGLTINENYDPDVKHDFLLGLNDIVKDNPRFKHSEGNSIAHIKSSLINKSIQLIIKEKDIFLGTWDGIYFCEFDGPRNRKIAVKIVKD
jgi:secondary thiamine-phosphate synthase enzyme